MQTVHTNAWLNSVIKYQYLVSCLFKEPLNMIKVLHISAANYLTAYQTIHERYHNKSWLHSTHLNLLLDIPNLTPQYIKDLRRFITLFHEHTQSLKALECDNKSESNAFLAAHLLRKLDSGLLLKLELFSTQNQCDNHTLPTWEEIITFCTTICESVEDAILHIIKGQSSTRTKHHPSKSVKAVHFNEAKFNAPNHTSIPFSTIKN